MPVKNFNPNPLAMLIFTMGIVFVWVFESWLGYPLILFGAVMFVLNSKF